MENPTVALIKKLAELKLDAAQVAVVVEAAYEMAENNADDTMGSQRQHDALNVELAEARAGKPRRRHGKTVLVQNAPRKPRGPDKAPRARKNGSARAGGVPVDIGV